MGLVSTLLQKIPGIKDIPGIDIIGGIADGLANVALVALGPVGWAVLAGKIAADIAVCAMDGDPKTDPMGAIFSNGLELVGGGVAGGFVKGGVAAVKAAATKGVANGAITKEAAEQVIKGKASKETVDISGTEKLVAEWKASK